MRNALLLLALLGVSSVPLHATAQVLVLEGEYDGELQGDDIDAFNASLEAGLERGAPGQVVSAADTAEALGELTACDGGDCALEIGFTVAASVAVRAEVYAEAEIYDFAVSVYDLNTGETLVTQTGDCTFCPIAEALDSFGFTAEAAIGAVSPMPEPTRGAEPEPEDPLAEVAPDPQEEPQPTLMPGAAYVEGEIQFNVSVVPDTATISVNGEAVGEGRARLDVAAQELAIDVTAAGYEAYTEDVSLRESMTGPIFLRVVLTPTVAAVTPPRATTGNSGPDFNRRAVGGTLMGVGAAAAIGGVALLALDGKTTCTDGPDYLCEDVWEFTAGGASLTALGGIAIGTGLGLIISTLGGDDPVEAMRDDRAGRSTTFSFAPARGGASVSFGSRF